MIESSVYRCHICGEEVSQIDEFPMFCRVTSDCQPWKKGGELGVCRRCGIVQKIVDDKFQNDCRAIYNDYCVYHQSEGEEQKVFEQQLGQSQFRSEFLLKEVFKAINLPTEGSLLDIGCGNGSLLRSFSKLYPEWRLAGSELDERNRQVIEQIKNVNSFYSCDIEDISCKFNIITMIHCLEHIIDPLKFLKNIREKLNSKGLLLVEVPNYKQNPFDLVIADHCSHFDIEIILKLFHGSGFEVIIASDRHIAKELTFLVKKSENIPVEEIPDSKVSPYDNVLNALEWLKETSHKASKIAEKGNFGIFGTSIAATWLYSELGDNVSFFVDEDRSRIGKEFMGHQIYHPKDVPADGNVFIGLPFPLALKIWERMKNYHAQFYLPPERTI